MNVGEGYLNYCCILATGKSEAPYLDKKKGMRTGKVVGVQLTPCHYKTTFKKTLKHYLQGLPLTSIKLGAALHELKATFASEIL